MPNLFYAGQPDYIEKLNTLATAASMTNGTVAASFLSLAVTGTATAASFVGPLTGNASTATTLATARNINGVAFNGSADITVTAAAGTLTGTTLAANVVNASLNSITPTGGILSIDGNLLLGTTSTASFDGAGGIGVSRSSAPAIFLESTGTGAQAFLTYVALDSSYRLYNSTTNSELLLVSASGNLLLGTTSAASFAGAGGIGVSRSSLPAIFLENTGTGAQAFMTYVAPDSSYRLYNSTTHSELLLVSASGNLLINQTTNPSSYKLAVTGNVGVTGSISATSLVDISAAGAGQIKFPATQNASADANTLDDYQEATYTGTATGMTTSPTGTVSYTLTGNEATLNLPEITGTSNATTFTVTGMPAEARPASRKTVLGRAQDNGGAIVPVRIDIETTGVLTIYANADAGAFTSSGTKTLAECSVTYTRV